MILSFNFAVTMNFTNFGIVVMLKVHEVGINEPVLPRKHRTPARFEEVHSDPHYPICLSLIFTDLYTLRP